MDPDSKRKKETAELSGEKPQIDGPGDNETSDEMSDELDDVSARPSQQLIEDSQLFQALDLEERESLFETGERVTYEPGEVILKEGEEGDSFYIIEDGEVEVSTVKDEKTVVLATLGRGDLFGEVTAFSGKPRTATVTAASLVDMIRFDNEELKSLLDKSPEVREELQAMILGRARDTIEKITNME
jgi:CRP-like cAMP-binding protein